MDACLVYAILETCLAQLSASGDVNIPSYSRHVASRQQLALSSVEQYVYVHDALAHAAEAGMLHSIGHFDDAVNGSMAVPV